MSELLSDSAIDEALTHLPDWSRDGDRLVRTVDFPDFGHAIQAVNRIAEIAEASDHHPDIDIRYRTVTFACATHSAGGITDKDTSLATEIDGVVDQLRS